MELALSHAVQPGSTPAVSDHDGPDFSPKPLPDGSHAVSILGAKALKGAPEIVPQSRPDLSARPPVVARQDNGVRWQRNPLQEPVEKPTPRGRRQPRHVVDAAVARGLEEALSASTLSVSITRTGRRMVEVNKAFYGQPPERNHRPRPIREGAGKGPRKQAPDRMRC